MVPAARCGVVVALWLGACGPSIGGVEGEADTNDAGPSAAETTSTTEPVTSGPATPPGSPSTDDGGVGSSGTVDDASTSDGRDDGGCGFLCAPDGGSSGECDLFTQNCPPGEKCMPWADDGGPAWNATRCSPLAKDPAQVGEPCMVEGSGVSGIDDCGVGLMCWNVDENTVGVCEDMCTGSVENPICENPEDVCMASNAGVVALCMAACHPLMQDCPIENEVCYPVQDYWLCAPDGHSEGYGYPCEFVNQCDQGSVCIVADAFTSCAGDWGCCTTLCDLNDAGADAQCQALDPAQTCEPWYADGQAPFGYADVGVCMIAGSP